MWKTLQKLLRRCDALLILLAGITSALLCSYYAPEGMGQEVQPGPGPLICASAAPEANVQSEHRSIPKTGPPVRFLMLNVRNYFVAEDLPRSKYPRSIKPVREREAVARVIASAKPEIVGLVEIGGEAAMRDLVRRLKSLGMDYPHSVVLERWGEDRALGILSCYPIAKDFSVANCLLEGRTGQRMLRGILDVLVELPDGRCFRIMGAHLKSKKTDDPTAAEALRNREARTLASHVQKAVRSMPWAPILVYGDWNAGPDEPSLAILTQGKTRESALRRLIPHDDRGESWTIYYKNGDLYSAFDQIYVNSVLLRRMGKEAQMGIVSDRAAREASDHRAVWCELR